MDVVWWAPKAACVQSSGKLAAGWSGQRRKVATSLLLRGGDSGPSRWPPPPPRPACPDPVLTGAGGGDTESCPQPQPGCPKSGPALLPLCPTPAQGLTRQPLQALGGRVIGPRAGTKQCVPKKGSSWVLAIKWGPGSQKGFRGSELLSSAPNFKPPAGPGPGGWGRAWKGVDGASVPRSARVLGSGVLASDSPVARPQTWPCLALPGWNALL